MRAVLWIAFLLVTTSAWGGPLVVERVSDAAFLTYGAYTDSTPDFTAFVTYHNELYFTASTTGDDIDQLYKTDGKSLTQFPVNPGIAVGTQFQEFEGQLYFRGDNGGGPELFRTDGTQLTKYNLPSWQYGSSPHNFSLFGDKMYFEAALLNSQGELRSTLLSVKNGQVATVGDDTTEASYPWQFAVGNTLYYTANGASGFELYATDGNTSHLVYDANPGPANSDPWFGGVLNGKFYFSAIGPQGRELYKTNGVATSKLPLAADPTPYSGPTSFYPFKNFLFFTANTGDGYELYRTDGTRITEFDLNPGPASSYPETYGATTVGDHLLMPAKGPSGLALYVFGADGGLEHTFEFHPNNSPQDELVFYSFKGAAYFEATGPKGAELYKTDGNTLTELPLMPDNTTLGGGLWNAVELNGEMYFPSTTAKGNELVKTDGTTLTILDINPGAADSYPSNLQVLGDQIVFEATGAAGPAIYSTDGTTIFKLIDLTPNPYFDGNFTFDRPAMSDFARLNDQLLFLANTPNGFRLDRIVGAPEPQGWLLMCFAAVGLANGRRRGR